MNIQSIELERVCGLVKQLPKNSLPEIVIAGKSNVGKSSLINALANRKAYARTSASPGKTATINFYLINKKFYLVDLPGYGYAKVSEKEKEKWAELMETYLHTSDRIRIVFLLVDSRHEPNANDDIMYEWITGNGYRPVIIRTKADKLKKTERPEKEKMIEEHFGNEAEYITVSSETKEGIPEVRSYIENRLKEK